MASLKQNRLNKLVEVLSSSPSWVSAPVLARMLNVSDRSIRSYAKELAAAGVPVQSSKEGYRLESSDNSYSAALETAGAATRDSSQIRRNKVCIALINSSEEVSLYDLADELCISESTVMSSVMPKVRELFGRYDIQVFGRGFRFSLVGSEQDKRRVLGHLATHDTDSYFTSVETLNRLFPDFDVESIMQRAVELCQESELVINNYALNNLLVHVLIIFARLSEGNELKDRDGLPLDSEELLERTGQQKEVDKLARGFASLVAEGTGCAIPEQDYRQIEVLVAMSAEHCSYRDLDFERLSRLADKRLLDSVKAISKNVADRYGIPPFDGDFLLQLSLHMYNVYQRASFKVRCPNPLAAQIKRDYAPVYDMAVFFCAQFSKHCGVTINEDEIAFVAFHIGAYLERSKGDQDAISCIVVVENYHSSSQDTISRLSDEFKREVSIMGAMSARHYLESRPFCDLLITTIDMPCKHPHKVLVGPIINHQGIHRIHTEIDDILQERRSRRARAFLHGALSPKLYLQDVSYADAESCISAMSKLCVSEGVADEGLEKDALARERMSSTAFTDDLAIPHPINTHANESFVCVLHANRPIPWDKKHDVKFVMLSDIAEKDMPLFRGMLDLVIERFTNVDGIARITGTSSFEEFAQALVK